MKPQTFIKSLTLWSACVLAAVSLVGCSRTVTWEEEVPLNTGETIWVKRSMPWVYKGGFGNPFDMSMLPTREQTMSFHYAGSEYSYLGRADVHWIAISPETRKPVLVAPAINFGWYTDNTYFCVVPYYVQLTPDVSGKHWTWPEKIEPWLYHLSANVMVNIPSLDEERKGRYSNSDRDVRDKTYRARSDAKYRIDPTYKASSCISRPASGQKIDGSKK